MNRRKAQKNAKKCKLQLAVKKGLLERHKEYRTIAREFLKGHPFFIGEPEE